MSPGFLLVAAAVVVLGLGAAIFFATRGESGDSEAVEQLQQAAANLPLDLADGTRLGRDDAPVKLTEFADFQCPFCLRVAAEDMPTVIDEYVKTGKVQLEFRNYPILGQESGRAARAALCMAEQDKFWQYHDEIYIVQAEGGLLSGAAHNRGRLSDEKLRELVTKVGGDVAAYDACLDDPASLEAVAEDSRAATQLGVSGTPSFFLNGRPLGGTPRDLDAWREVLDQVIAEAEASPTQEANGSASPSPTTAP